MILNVSGNRKLVEALKLQTKANQQKNYSNSKEKTDVRFYEAACFG